MDDNQRLKLTTDSARHCVYFNVAISAVIRIESVFISNSLCDGVEHSTNISASCVTHSCTQGITGITLETGIDINEPVEKKEALLESLKEGSVYCVEVDDAVIIGGELHIYSPELLPYKGDKVAFCKALDDALASGDDDLSSKVNKTNKLYKIEELSEVCDREPVTVFGKSKEVKLLSTRSGDRMAFVTVEDASGAIEIVIFPQQYGFYEVLLDGYDGDLFYSGALDVDEEVSKILLDYIVPPWSPDAQAMGVK